MTTQTKRPPKSAPQQDGFLPASDPDKVAKREEEPEREPILKLTTLAPERPYADIDSVPHEFRLLQEFGSAEHQQWTRDSRRYDELFGREKALTRPEKVMMERLLDRLFRQALIDPDALLAQLKDPEAEGGSRLSGAIKREIVLTFTNAPSLMQAMARLKELREAADEMEQDNEADESST